MPYLWVNVIPVVKLEPDDDAPAKAAATPGRVARRRGLVAVAPPPPPPVAPAAAAADVAPTPLSPGVKRPAHAVGWARELERTGGGPLRESGSQPRGEEALGADAPTADEMATTVRDSSPAPLRPPRPAAPEPRQTNLAHAEPTAKRTRPPTPETERVARDATATVPRKRRPAPADGPAARQVRTDNIARIVVLLRLYGISEEGIQLDQMTDPALRQTLSELHREAQRLSAAVREPNGQTRSQPVGR